MTRITGILVERLAHELRARVAGELAERNGEPSDAISIDGTGFRTPGGDSIGLAEAVRRVGRRIEVELTYEARPEDSVTVHTVQAAEVDVDAQTGQVRPRRLISVHEAGRIVNRRAFEAQIEGAAVQGLGYALMEGLQIEEGRVTNVNLHEYKIPSIEDVPSLEAVIVCDERLGITPIGEGTVGMAPAIANAVIDAVGSGTLDLPISPEAVLHLAAKGR